jgi:hypothetical protein
MSTTTVNPLKSFFSGISGGTKSDVITQALAEHVLAKLGESNTLGDVEKMILNEHKPKNFEVSEIKVHSRRAMKWTPKTGEEMRMLFEHRDKSGDNYVNLCPQENLGVWMKLKMRKELEDFKENLAVHA